MTLSIDQMTNSCNKIQVTYQGIQQNSLTAVEHVKLEASAAEEQNLLYEQSDLRIEVVELTRLAAIKVSYKAPLCLLYDTSRFAAH